MNKVDRLLFPQTLKRLLKKVVCPLYIIFALFSTAIGGDTVYRSEHYILTNPRITAGGGNSGRSEHYIITNVQIGNMAGGKAKSEHYTIEAFPVTRRLPPNPPTVHSVPSPTNNPLITLIGAKERGVSIYINGYEVVPFNNEISWKSDITLCEGCNYFIITARNKDALYSSAVNVTIFLDTSPPPAPVVVDDGDFTNLPDQLHAVWSAEDNETGIVEYQYAIDALKYDTDAAGWTSAGAGTAVTRRDMALIQGKTYYISVKAKNGAGSWSQPGYSDGVRVNQTIPAITDIRPPAGTSNFIGDNVNFLVDAQDKDGDSLSYRFLLDGQIIRHWQADPDFSWQSACAASGIHLIKIEVSDDNGGQVSGDVDMCLFRRPIPPPAP